MRPLLIRVWNVELWTRGWVVVAVSGFSRSWVHFTRERKAKVEEGKFDISSCCSADNILEYLTNDYVSEARIHSEQRARRERQRKCARIRRTKKGKKRKSKKKKAAVKVSQVNVPATLRAVKWRENWLENIRRVLVVIRRSARVKRERASGKKKLKIHFLLLPNELTAVLMVGVILLD